MVGWLMQNISNSLDEKNPPQNLYSFANYKIDFSQKLIQQSYIGLNFKGTHPKVVRGV